MQSPVRILRRRAAVNIGVLIAALLAWPVISTAQPTTPAAAQPSPATPGKPIGTERENWRKEMRAIPWPTHGCYTATYPERQWREIPCKTPPNKLYLPRAGGMTRNKTVGGAAGPDFSAMVTGHITQAEGSFDSVTGVTLTPNYSLQLNTDFFPTRACKDAPNTGCKGWEQFVYDSDGSGFIQYWLIQYGPAGTLCPMPRGAHCVEGQASNDGWCPSTVGTDDNPLYCVINSAVAVGPPAEPATSLGQLRVSGAAAGVNGAANDAITVTVGDAMFARDGNNHFPDLGQQWREAEFNVFGAGNGRQAIFNGGSSATVRIEVTSGTNVGPNCDLVSFTAKSTNLTLQNIAPVAPSGALPALMFAESNPALPGRTADCKDTTSAPVAALPNHTPDDVTMINPAIFAPADMITIVNDHY